MPATDDGRVRVLDASDLTDAAGTLQEIDEGRLHAALVRGVYTASAVERIVQAIEQGEFDHPFQERDSSDQRSVQIRTLGIPISPSDLYPSGPDPEAYHDAATRFRARTDALFAPDVPFPERASEVLSALSGTPVELAHDERGRPYGELTIRTMPVGCGLPPHCENHYMHIPIYDGVRERVRLDRKVGFFVVMRRPPQGGKFTVYDDLYAPGQFAFGTRSLDPVPDHPHALLDALPGDMVVVGSGPRYHQVTRVEGHARWSVGGFGAFARDFSRFVRWA